MSDRPATGTERARTPGNGALRARHACDVLVIGSGAGGLTAAITARLHGLDVLVVEFYAVRILPGSLGTFAGLRTDAPARVLAKDGRPIGGLHAVGSDMASIMGGSIRPAASRWARP